MASFSQCSSIKKIQQTVPLDLGQVYYQAWIAGIEGGGAGLNIYIPTEDNSIELDSVYFRGKAAKLEFKNQNGIIYIGRFISDFNKKKDIVMSNEPNTEFGNEIEIIGIQMIGIDNINDGLKFAQKLNLSYKLGYNPDNSTIKKYKINSFPTTIFASKSNNNFIIWDGYIGYDDLLNNTKNIKFYKKKVAIVINYH